LNVFARLVVSSVEKHAHNGLQLAHRVVEVGFCVQAFLQDRKEVVDARGVLLGGDGADADGLLVDHLHDLPLLAVFARAPVLAAPEAVCLLVVVFVRQRPFQHQRVGRMQSALNALLETELDGGELLLGHDALEGVLNLGDVDAMAVAHELFRVTLDVFSCVRIVVSAKEVLLECGTAKPTLAVFVFRVSILELLKLEKIKILISLLILAPNSFDLILLGVVLFYCRCLRCIEKLLHLSI
jgi:hypothetical protein